MDEFKRISSLRVVTSQQLKIELKKKRHRIAKQYHPQKPKTYYPKAIIKQLKKLKIYRPQLYWKISKLRQVKINKLRVILKVRSRSLWVLSKKYRQNLKLNRKRRLILNLHKRKKIKDRSLFQNLNRNRKSALSLVPNEVPRRKNLKVKANHQSRRTNVLSLKVNVPNQKIKSQTEILSRQ